MNPRNGLGRRRVKPVLHRDYGGYVMVNWKPQGLTSLLATSRWS